MRYTVTIEETVTYRTVVETDGIETDMEALSATAIEQHQDGNSDEVGNGPSVVTSIMAAGTYDELLPDEDEYDHSRAKEDDRNDADPVDHDLLQRLLDISRNLRTDDDTNPEYDRALVELTCEASGLPITDNRDAISTLILGDRT